MRLAAQNVELEEMSRGSGDLAFEMCIKNAPEHDKRVERDIALKIGERLEANGKYKSR